MHAFAASACLSRRSQNLDDEYHLFEEEKRYQALEQKLALALAEAQVW